MSVMGDEVPDFSIPVCNKFRPTVLDGQLCYQVDVNELWEKVDSNGMATKGLTFLMDYNEDRMGLSINDEDESLSGKDLDEMQEDDKTRFEAKIYIETLGMHNYHN